MAAREEARKRAEGSTANAAAAGEASRPVTRTWTDRTGQHKIVGRFVEVVNKETVVLELPTGEKRSVPLAKLSSEDIYEAVKSDLLRQGVVPENKAEDSPFKALK
jgi:hypothetical protein